MSDIGGNLNIVRERITRASERSGRPPDAVILIAVTKAVPPQRIIEAVAAGVTHFGENRVQEAYAKYAARDHGGEIPREGMTLHMIGTLQRNKARKAAIVFDWVQSVDRPALAVALDKAAEQERAGEPLPVLLEVNLSGEVTKSGVAEGELPRLADAVTRCSHLRPQGLMTIARFGAGEAELRRTFAALRRLLEELQRSHPGDWRHLSMGMTDDYEYAVEEGATMVRVGRAIFGERKT
jgi:pyridoxal phosphate enzyme (YggS family)